MSSQHPGIAKTASGFRVFVRVHAGPGGLKTKRFPPEATLTAMKQWREDQRVQSRHRPAQVRARGTLSADVAHYLKLVATMPSLSDRTRDLAAWTDVLGMRPRHALTRDDYRLVLNEWRLTGKQGTPLAASTVNHRRTALMHLYSVLDGKGAPNPLRDIPPFAEPPAEPRDLTIATVLSLIGSMKPSKSRARLKVLAWTGIRGTSELGKMKPAHVDLVHGVCWVPTGKHGKPRQLVLNADGIAAWQEFSEQDAWGEYSGASLKNAFRRAVTAFNARRAKVTPKLPPLVGVRVYDLRHTIATAMRRAGADLADIQAHLGHTSPRMTQRYAPFHSDKIRKALDQVGRPNADDPPPAR